MKTEESLFHYHENIEKDFCRGVDFCFLLRKISILILLCLFFHFDVTFLGRQCLYVWEQKTF